MMSRAPANDLDYVKMSISLSPEADAILTQWMARTENFNRSNVISKMILAANGNLQIMRHALADPINAINVLAQLIGHDAKHQETVQQIQSAVKELENLISPVMTPIDDPLAG